MRYVRVTVTVTEDGTGANFLDPDPCLRKLPELQLPAWARHGGQRDG